MIISFDKMMISFNNKKVPKGFSYDKNTKGRIQGGSYGS